MKIVADSHIPYVEKYFGGYGELVLRAGRDINHSDVSDADILLVRSITPVNQALLENSAVKFVGSVTAGSDHLERAWLNQVGIPWYVARGFNAPPVADYVIGVIAALQRKQLLSQYHAKAAVIGVGRVGSLVVERLKLLGFSVTLSDPIRAQAENDFLHQALEEIADVDLIILHVPLTSDGPYPTHHFIDKHFLKRQKPGCVLLNASRGAVINSQELKVHGTHLRWAFDVWEHEPSIDKAVLEHAAIATPHIAGYSVQSKMRGIEMIYRIACETKIIPPQTVIALEMPHQQLTFAGSQHHWQDIVMGVFNPLVMTGMMRTVILPEENTGELFDIMRNKFNYRHELAFTSVLSDQLLDEDRRVLVGLGICI
jgi:erythronate-4-phosphate dehydrogenase